MTKVPQSVVSEIQALRAAGTTQIKISKLVGCGMRIVKKYCKGTTKCVRPSLVRAQLPLITELRSQGLSYKEIGERLGCSAASVCIVLDGTPLPEAVRVRNYKASVRNIEGGSAIRDMNAKAHRLNEYNAALSESMSTSDAFMAALYAGEGGKSGYFRISNANPSIVKFVVGYYAARGISANDVALDISLHSDADEVAARKFWTGLTNLPVRSVRVTQSKGGKRHTTYSLPYGTMLFMLKGTLARSEYERMRGLCKQFDVSVEPKLFRGDQHVFWKMHRS